MSGVGTVLGLHFQPRAEPSARMRVAAPLIAIGLTLAFGVLFFAAVGRDPAAFFYAFFVAPLSSENGISEWLLKASSLTLIGLGLAVGFRANVWNIGAEGQFIMGAIAAAAVALFAPEMPTYAMLPLMFLAGLSGGLAWAAIPAFLRQRFATNEILVSLMLTYVASAILSWLVHGPWRDPEGFNYPQTAIFPAQAMLPVLFDGYRLNVSIFITAAAVIIAWIFGERTFIGYKMRVGGDAPNAARYAGFAEGQSIWIGMLAGGAAAGIAGMIEAAGPLGQLSPQISPGYGFAAIIVAFVGRLNPFGIVLAGLLLSLLYLGGENAQMTLAMPAAVSRIFQGVLLFFLLGADFLIFFRIKRTER
jgi:general nucleoside transport system permease protein